MFEIVCTFSFHDTAGAKVKEDFVRAWDGLTKEQVVDDFEVAHNNAMTKMMNLSSEMNSGNAPRPTTTDPVELRCDITITEDGVKWMRVNYEWPKMGEEQQSLLIGMLSGEISAMPRATKSREKRQPKKDKKEH